MYAVSVGPNPKFAIPDIDGVLLGAPQARCDLPEMRRFAGTELGTFKASKILRVRPEQPCSLASGRVLSAPGLLSSPRNRAWTHPKFCPSLLVHRGAPRKRRLPRLRAAVALTSREHLMLDPAGRPPTLMLFREANPLRIASYKSLPFQ